MPDEIHSTNETANLPLYVPHVGTLRISGMTQPRKAAWRAMSLIEEKVPDVEFLFIGASAGQQAMKSIGILTDLHYRKYKDDFIVVFRPLRFRTTIEGTNKEVDAQVWRAHVIDLGYLMQLKSAHEKAAQGSPR